jgi:hypothetical protein
VDNTNVTTGFTVNFTSILLGHAAANQWEFGDGTIISNQLYQPFISHKWNNPGDYVVIFRGFDDSYPTGAIAAVTIHVAERPIHYVSLISTNPVAPYTSWATAATNIQDAVDAASLVGALVLVSNGVYHADARYTNGDWNRLITLKALTIQSVNGPAVTAIDGGASARCVYLAENTLLSGLTLTNGYAYNGGGAYGGEFTNCTLVGNRSYGQAGGGAIFGTLIDCVLLTNRANYQGGGAYSCTLNNCLLAFNSAGSGGGAYSCTLNSCLLLTNSASQGAGAYSCALNNCALTNNRAGGAGGGVYSSTLNNCILATNFAGNGGGAYQSTLSYCTLTNNFATYGGGAYDSTLNYSLLVKNQARYWGGGTYVCSVTNCSLTGNSALYGGGGYQGSLNNCIIFGNRAEQGGGAYDSTANNCVLTGNSATNSGGGAAVCTLNNSIIYYNTAPDAPDFTSDCWLPYSCAPVEGFGNITNAPAFVDWAGGNFRLQSNSPCINSGFNDFAPAGPDLDGNPRIAGGTVDIGAYEFQAPSSLISYAWLQHYGWPIDGSADHVDPDGDHFDNYNEWRAGTSPTDASSLLRITSISNSPAGVTIQWHDTGIAYYLERSINLNQITPFTRIADPIFGGLFTDTEAITNGSFFYRVGVR